MNKKEVLELKRRLKKDQATFSRLVGCYVDCNHEKVCKFGGKFLTLEEDEYYKYLEISNKVLSGTLGNKAEEKSCPQVHMNCSYIGRELYIEISDSGVGIQDVAKAMEPLYTSKPQLDRSGMGFSFMEAFMDALTVTSEPGHGTTVKMKKVL